MNMCVRKLRMHAMAIAVQCLSNFIRLLHLLLEWFTFYASESLHVWPFLLFPWGSYSV